MAIRNDITGQIFGNWTVISTERLNGISVCRCICKCGAKKIVQRTRLLSGRSKSCGCLRYDPSINHLHSLHGQRTPEYRAWCDMKTRCYNENYDGYQNYGGRGIIVCDRWLESFNNFFEDMGNRPSSEHSLDRFPDTNGNYGPENCRWATIEQQMNNMTTNKIISYKGQTKTLSEWCSYLGLPYKVIGQRFRYG